MPEYIFLRDGNRVSLLKVCAALTAEQNLERQTNKSRQWSCSVFEEATEMH